MPKANTGVIPIRRDFPLSVADRMVVDVAFNLWLSRGFKGGTPAQDLLTAIQEVKGAAPAGLFLVSKRSPAR